MNLGIGGKAAGIGGKYCPRRHLRILIDINREDFLMKYVLISLAESSKIDFSGAEKLSKTDHIIFVYVKGKKTLSASVKEALEEVKAEVEYFEIAAASELSCAISYLIGYHTASKHEVILIAGDKSKYPGKVIKEIKVYSAFRAAVGGTSSTSTAKKTTAKKSTTAKKTSSTKTTAAKKTSTAKKSTSTAKKSTAKKSTTAKKTTKKTASKKKSDGLDSILDSLAKGNTAKLGKSLGDLAGSLFK